MLSRHPGSLCLCRCAAAAVGAAGTAVLQALRRQRSLPAQLLPPPSASWPPAESLVRMAARGESLQRWRQATHLIIDEVSMMDGRLFDALEHVARKVRGSAAPFGGIQVCTVRAEGWWLRCV